MGRYTGDIATESDPLMEGDEPTYPRKDRRKCYVVCVSATCIIFLLVGLLTYFLFPRSPDVEVKSDEIIIKEWNWNSNGIALDIFVPISVYNPNYIPLTLSVSQCNVFYKDSQFAYCKPISMTKFASFATTNVTLEILSISPTSNSTYTYFLNNLIQDCGNPPSSSKVFILELKSTVKVRIIADDLNVPFSHFIQIPCAV